MQWVSKKLRESVADPLPPLTWLTSSTSPAGLLYNKAEFYGHFLSKPSLIFVEMKIDKQMNQSINIKFSAKLGKISAELNEVLQKTYGNDALKEWSVCEWVQRFHNGREVPKDDARSESTSTSCANESNYCMHFVVVRAH